MSTKAERIREVESGTALVHVEGYVWCDKWNEVHSDTLNPRGYVDDGHQDYCTVGDHREMYMEPEPAYAPGMPFVCYCSCHSPLGFRLMPGKLAPPNMRPCIRCVRVHP